MYLASLLSKAAASSSSAIPRLPLVTVCVAKTLASCTVVDPNECICFAYNILKVVRMPSLGNGAVAVCMFATSASSGTPQTATTGLLGLGRPGMERPRPPLPFLRCLSYHTVQCSRSLTDLGPRRQQSLWLRRDRFERL